MARSKPFFELPSPKVDFPEAERKLMVDWNKKSLVRKYLNRNINSGKRFSFLDGPITANNPMGVHHAWGRAYKDIWQRFKNMQGFRQRFQNGFDCQGLWVEVEVEKELGFKTKKDIEAFGVAKFVQLCRDRVKKYSEIQTRQSKRLGYFMDWDNSYYTLSEDNNYMIWNFLKKCHENGWIYKGNDVVPWCPRCETAISEHEILTENYKEIEHETLFLAFPVVGGEEEYLLVWTTTPWTVPANIAIAVDPDIEYAQIEANKRKYWVAKGAVIRAFSGLKYKEIKTVRGAKLVGLRYKGAFDSLTRISEVINGKNDKMHTVIATDNLILPISTDEGTGLVHVSTGTGAEDHRLGKEIGLPIVAAIDDRANYLEGYGSLTGSNAKKHPELVIDYLESFESGRFLLKSELHKHRYPSCWRCKTELVWKITDEWYIAMDKPAVVSKKIVITIPEKWSDEESQARSLPDKRTLRERMKVVTQKINWLPVFGLDREMDWLNNMHDWLISKKNRYWGLALPIWECPKCRHFEVIGSKEELEKKVVEGWKEFKNKSPHKPEIDGVKIKCSFCGSVAFRIEPVGNPWLDAGIVPFSTISEDNKACGFEVSKTKPSYVADKNAWQNWFPADFVTESFPGQFKNWFYALIAMSTVLEDTIPFKTVLGFSTMVDSQGRGFHKSLGNAIEFVESADKAGADVIRWMCARQNPSENLQFGYDLADEVRRKFHLKLWNVYNFFVTYANLDGWSPLKNMKHGSESQNVLDRWVKARFAETVNSVSQNLEKFDSCNAAGEIEKLVDDISLWFVRRSRARVGPAAQEDTDKNAFYATLYRILCDLSKLIAPFMPFISEVIYRNLTKEESVHLSDWPSGYSEPDNKDLALIKEMQSARLVVEQAHALRKEAGIAVRQPLSLLEVTGVTLSDQVGVIIADEVNVKKVVCRSEKGTLSVKLDTHITESLEEEAYVRDLIRKIQAERKKMGLNLTQKINIKVPRLPASKELTQWMLKKAQIENLEKGGFKVTESSS
jgi:isoleucyl-tRNA synthetase